ncbi:hypothetical protein AB0F30_22400 [Streptomyces sp. NPDC029006]|uniref:hypothetical protein n=1 Tax=Streptomyces sp. NPDC029006 TaxID=3155467 RepID=UPI0033E0172A
MSMAVMGRAAHFRAVVTEQVDHSTALAAPEVLHLVGISPSARHVSPAVLKGGGLLLDQVTVSVPATAYERR